jgi:DNA-directed RNA polymerase specialized sigma24 family protein
MKEQKPHYVNNAEFSQAVVDYVTLARVSKEQGETKPVITNYIASCFLKIAEGLSHKANFVRYTYREEMVMDAVENCLKAIENYNLEAATRTGKPNAFAYFTQIAWYAFLRRIEKEKKQQDIKLKYLSESGIELLVAEEIDNNEASRQTQAFVDELRERIDLVKENDRMVKEYSKKQKKQRIKRADSDLSEFMVGNG